MTMHSTFEQFLASPFETNFFYDQMDSDLLKENVPEDCLNDLYIRDDSFRDHVNALLETNYSRVFVSKESVDNGHYTNVSDDNISAVNKGFFAVTEGGRVIEISFGEDICIQST